MPQDCRLIRSAAWLFVVAGVMTLVTSWLPNAGVISPDFLDGVGLAAILLGIATWLAPWERWNPQASLLLVPAALALAALGDSYGSDSPYIYGVYFVVIFAWVGLCHERWVGLRLVPAALPFYLMPLLVRGHAYHGALASVAVTIPVAVLIGETVAWAMAQSREARRSAEHRALLLRTVARGTTTMTALDPEAILAAVVDSAMGLDMDSAWLAAFSPDGAWWDIRHGRGIPEDVIGLPQPAGSGTPGVVRAERGPVALLDAADRPDPAAVEPAARACVASPIWVHGHLVAALVASTTHRTLTEEDAEALTLLAHHAGRTLENADRYGEERRAREILAEVSVRDELTGVGNRRHAVSLLQSLQPGDAVVMIDLDHFKRVNDTEGHDAGDRVLLALADHLRAGVRDADTVARYGGEEFLVVLRGAGEGGTEIAERLCATWRDGAPRTTFSAGVAVHISGQSAPATVARADAALYAAKRTGRDRVCENRTPVAV